MRTEICKKNCYILREKATSHYYFLDMNDCGIRLFNDTLFNAETFRIDESIKIEKW
jgi:hypothetical protein